MGNGIINGANDEMLGSIHDNIICGRYNMYNDYNDFIEKYTAEQYQIDQNQLTHDYFLDRPQIWECLL